MQKGILLILSGFAGSGKGTVVKELLNRYENYSLSVSATTRSPRPGEQDGREYFFKTVEQCEAMIEKGAFLEYAKYVDNYYGTPREYVEKMLNEGKDVILEIEQQGALQIKEKLPDALLLFIMPPSVREIYNRLKGRGTETEEVIMKRMTQGAKEARVIDRYDYLIVNDDLDKCIEDVHNTIQCSKFSTDRNKDIISRMIDEFDGFIV